ncbi:hypothetical protein GCM10011494_24390 [Novosphingobium endophyticum]|uniref:Uncharacterized protein n=1 Tax=Novosphingobium endophyticum TaxID=1955250 RepID=A0A916X6C7_9SPHN|nr:hypothetical protein GCM10011494_24390 [Novosphingobium endophyticum]
MESGRDMPREWASDEEKAREARDTKWLRIDMWAEDIGLAAIMLIVLKFAFG